MVALMVLSNFTFTPSNANASEFVPAIRDNFTATAGDLGLLFKPV